MSAYFEYNFEELDNNELRINGKSSYTDDWDTIIIKKEWIAWIITTLRNLTYEDYNTWQKGIENDYEDCELLILVYLFEGEYSYIKILPSWKDEERITPAIKIPYLSWNKRPPWSEREEEEKKKGKRKRKKDDQSDDGRISVRFIGEIDPRDYFGLWNDDNDKHKE